MLLKALNTKRRDHIVKDLELKESIASQLAKAVKDSTRKWDDFNNYPEDVTKPSEDYIAFWNYNADAAKLFSSAAAVDGWYAGRTEYDFATKQCKPTVEEPLDTVTAAEGAKFFTTYGLDMEECNDFRGIIWAGAKTAAFA